MKYWQLTQHYSKRSYIYSLPKIHQDDIPLRLIVNNRGSACHPLNHFFMEIVTPLMGKSSSCQELCSLCGEKNISNTPVLSNQMVGLDVVSLFMRISTEETLTMVWDKLTADLLLKECTCIPIDNLTEKSTFRVEMIYFGMGSDIYQ